MSHGRLGAIADRLRAEGGDPGALDVLQEELDALQRPGRVAQAAAQIRAVAVAQWGHLRGEVAESREVIALLRQWVRQRELDPVDRDKILSQSLDLLRMVPAAGVAFLNWILPVPGTSAATPWLLMRLGLLPSRWREAFLLRGLRGETARLEQLGFSEAAHDLEELRFVLEAEADSRAAASHHGILLSAWDADGNGRIDPEEAFAYHAAVSALSRLYARHGHQQRWFLLCRGEVFGPVRLKDFCEREDPGRYLVCFDGRGGWVEAWRVVRDQAGANTIG